MDKKPPNNRTESIHITRLFPPTTEVAIKYPFQVVCLALAIKKRTWGDADVIHPWLESARASNTRLSTPPFQSPAAFKNAGAD
jgi:hypothetical protein